MSYTSVDKPCLACGHFLVDLHHVKTRGAGGCDSSFNLMPLCRKHHTEVHTIGITSMSEKYTRVNKKIPVKKAIIFIQFFLVG